MIDQGTFVQLQSNQGMTKVSVSVKGEFDQAPRLW